MRRTIWPATALVLLLAACGGAETELDPAAVERGAFVYEGTCQICHGPNGQGVEGLGKPWVNSEFIDGLNDDEMLQFLIEGRAADHPDNTTGIAMMPRGGNSLLTDDDLRDVIAYMRSLNLDA
jgi:mono/diheme cytochrome c family protein